MTKFSHLHIAAFFAALVLCAAAALAQTYPSKAIRIVVPYSAGGGADLLARIFSQKFNDSWKYPVLVDNRPGAAGAIGTGIVSNAAPDGYTLLFSASSPIVINQSLYPELGYDPVKVLAPIAFVGSSPLLLVTHPALPVKTVKELILMAKASPNKLNYGSGGSGTPAHLAAEMFKAFTEVKMAHIPFKGSAPSVIAVVSGQVDLTFAAILATLPQVGANRLRALAVTTPTRIQIVPHIPTVAEAGVPGFESQQWYGLFGPAALPTDIVNKLHADSMRILGLPEVREVMSRDGATPGSLTTDQFVAFINSEAALWAKVIKKSGIRAE